MALYICGGIFLLLVLLLLTPVFLTVSLDGESDVRVRYLFITYRFRTPEQEQDSDDISTIKDKKLRDTLNQIKFIVKIATDSGKTLLSRAVLDKLSIKLVIGSDDAAQTALAYGIACSVVYPAVGLICAPFKRVKKAEPSVQADFQSNHIQAAAYGRLHISLFSLIRIGLGAVLALVRHSEEIKTNKGGANNGGTSN